MNELNSLLLQEPSLVASIYTCLQNISLSPSLLLHYKSTYIQNLQSCEIKDIPIIVVFSMLLLRVVGEFFIEFGSFRLLLRGYPDLKGFDSTISLEYVPLLPLYEWLEQVSTNNCDYETMILDYVSIALNQCPAFCKQYLRVLLMGFTSITSCYNRYQSIPFVCLICGASTFSIIFLPIPIRYSLWGGCDW